MYAEERQRTIVNLAVHQDRVAVSELAEQFGVTTETIRRDLDVLDQRGILRRVHGGAVVAENVSLLEAGLAEREPANAIQKARIAEAALAYLPGANGSVLLDAGTTTGRLAALLNPGTVTTVITNSLPIASQLAANAVNVRLLGGRVRGVTGATVGSEAAAALVRLRCDVAFLGTNGISLRHGLSTPDPEEAAVKEAMAQAASRVVVLADSSKVGAELLVGFAALARIDVLITDDGLPASDRADLEQAGVTVVIA
jgi:DeoR family transcriptional regulator, fructose operon transcriptional repressor